MSRGQSKGSFWIILEVPLKVVGFMKLVFKDSNDLRKTQVFGECELSLLPRWSNSPQNFIQSINFETISWFFLTFSLYVFVCCLQALLSDDAMFTVPNINHVLWVFFRIFRFFNFLTQMFYSRHSSFCPSCVSSKQKYEKRNTAFASAQPLNHLCSPYITKLNFLI